MNPEMNDCLKQGKIVRFPEARKLSAKELEVAGEDLKACRESMEQKNYKWATVQAYYAMFHAARTLLYHKGYREKSHYCLIRAVKAFYVDENLLEARLVESFQMAKALREGADYENTYDAETAASLGEQAGEFIKTAQAIIGEKK
ncbi:MAG: HEPN domain-containing protein [Candidatus Omnitrophota bacterium]